MCLLLYEIILVIVLPGCSTEWRCSEQISESMWTSVYKVLLKAGVFKFNDFSIEGNCFNTTPGFVLSDMSDGIWGTSTLSTAACHRFGFLTPLLLEQSESPSSCPEGPSLSVFHGVVVLVRCHKWGAHQNWHNICETIKIKISILTKLFPSCKSWSLLYRYNRIKKCLLSLEKI